MRIDPRRLAVLLAVHRAGGVLAAADVLRLSPSAVSQQIKRLEAEAGVQVLRREPAGATLTAAGRVLAETAEHIEAEISEAARTVAGLAGEVSGSVVVGAFQSAIRAILVPAARQVAEAMPGLDLRIHEISGSTGRRKLRSGDLDVLVMEHDAHSHPPAPAGMQDIPFLDEPWLAVTPASLPAPSTLMDLAGHTWLGVAEDGAAAKAVERVTTSLGLTPTWAHEYDDFDVAIAMVAAGMGIALLPSLALHRRLPEGVEVTAVPGLGLRRLVMRHRVTSKEPRPAVQAVIDAVTHVAADLEMP